MFNFVQSAQTTVKHFFSIGRGLNNYELKKQNSVNTDLNGKKNFPFCRVQSLQRLKKHSECV